MKFSHTANLADSIERSAAQGRSFARSTTLRTGTRETQLGSGKPTCTATCLPGVGRFSARARPSKRGALEFGFDARLGACEWILRPANSVRKSAIFRVVNPNFANPQRPNRSREKSESATHQNAGARKCELIERLRAQSQSVELRHVILRIASCSLSRHFCSRRQHALSFGASHFLHSFQERALIKWRCRRRSRICACELAQR